jgi:hypothetical protein
MDKTEEKIFATKSQKPKGYIYYSFLVSWWQWKKI